MMQKIMLALAIVIASCSTAKVAQDQDIPIVSSFDQLEVTHKSGQRPTYERGIALFGPWGPAEKKALYEVLDTYEQVLGGFFQRELLAVEIAPEQNWPTTGPFSEILAFTSSRTYKIHGHDSHGYERQTVTLRTKAAIEVEPDHAFQEMQTGHKSFMWTLCHELGHVIFNSLPRNEQDKMITQMAWALHDAQKDVPLGRTLGGFYEWLEVKANETAPQNDQVTWAMKILKQQNLPGLMPGCPTIYAESDFHEYFADVCAYICMGATYADNDPHLQKIIGHVKALWVRVKAGKIQAPRNYTRLIK